jgi:drug/metabolite transporter (DMT)-like permease
MTITATSISRSNSYTDGIALMCGALICFACLDASAKWLNHYMEPMQTVFLRYAISLIFVTALLNPAASGHHFKTNRPWLQVSRSLMLLLATMLNIIALQYLQLAETMSIMFTTPFFVALLAGPLLGEWISLQRLGAVVVGFLGVLLVVRPGTGELHPYAAFSVVGAICYALYNLATRFLAAHDSSETTMFYSGLVGTCLSLPFIPFIWSTPPSPVVWIVVLLIGGFGAAGHWLLILAHRRAPASVLAPFIFTEIIWMIALGYLLFGDLPDRYTLSGALIVILAGLYLLYVERNGQARWLPHGRGKADVSSRRVSDVGQHSLQRPVGHHKIKRAQ